MKRRKRPSLVSQGVARKVSRKPTEDSERQYLDWHKDRRVILPHDHLVDSYAITLTEFRELTA